MAFREKITWLTLIALVASYAVYFLVVGPSAAFGRDSLLDLIWSFGLLAITHALIVAVGAIVLAIAHSKQANQPADERERAIAQRGLALGYYLMLSGLLFVGVVMPFSEPAYKIINMALAVVVTAEVARYSAVLIGYRRG